MSCIAFRFYRCLPTLGSICSASNQILGVSHTGRMTSAFLSIVYSKNGIIATIFLWIFRRNIHFIMGMHLYPYTIRLSFQGNLIRNIVVAYLVYIIVVHPLWCGGETQQEFGAEITDTPLHYFPRYNSSFNLRMLTSSLTFNCLRRIKIVTSFVSSSLCKRHL